MTDWEEKACQLCYGIAGLYHRREHLIAEGETDKAVSLEEPIRVLLDDIEQWFQKKG